MSEYPLFPISEAVPAENLFASALQITIDAKMTSANDNNLNHSRTPSATDVKLKVAFCDVGKRRQTNIFAHTSSAKDSKLPSLHMHQV